MVYKKLRALVCSPKNINNDKFNFSRPYQCCHTNVEYI